MKVNFSGYLFKQVELGGSNAIEIVRGGGKPQYLAGTMLPTTEEEALEMRTSPELFASDCFVWDQDVINESTIGMLRSLVEFTANFRKEFSREFNTLKRKYGVDASFLAIWHLDEAFDDFTRLHIVRAKNPEGLSALGKVSVDDSKHPDILTAHVGDILVQICKEEK